MKTKFNLLILIFLLSSCSKDIEEITLESNLTNEKTKNNVLMELSYDIETSQDYEDLPKFSLKEYSLLDWAEMNPTNEKQHIKMQILENGQINLTIKELELKNKIKIKHKILENDTPKIVKTVITGKVVNFYDKKGNIIGSHSIEVENQKEIAELIKTLGEKFSNEDAYETLAKIQRYQFLGNLDKYLKKPALYNVKISEQGNNIISLRMPSQNFGLKNNTEIVFLLDKKNEKIMASRIYSDNKILKSTYFGYDKEKHFLSTIVNKVYMTLNSGKKIVKTSNTKIDNYKVNI